ncbi:MAG: tRNA (N6-threonylcarbamoyladenosine(37)-N6)-methyltransferase TrmO [Desulfoprunum sp.]|jgi:tRNA-Thr(GGU) m(6)t(6)A37 methyltransferase TsaA|uniref:tRNA (N6-threonylcarbamoyladenosine(37)-N6)-methyltransferase TrmO n=1 Tax=Desulfoprunum sp. TaxID=2020866 RepID=UPI00052B7CEF|nr:S-adenosyl-L-methionine-binding protein [Desulfobulbus sp. Tol-SR]
MQPIGIIHSPFKNLRDMPIQPKGAAVREGAIEVFDQFAEGLRDLDGFSHIYMLYTFHQAQRTELSVVPFMDTVARGVFATRSPLRPNHIGLSIVEMVKVTANIVIIRGVDVLDGTPLLDIKPYVAAFDEVKVSRSGWMQASREEVSAMRSDGRFVG